VRTVAISSAVTTGRIRYHFLKGMLSSRRSVLYFVADASQDAGRSRHLHEGAPHRRRLMPSDGVVLRRYYFQLVSFMLI